MSAQAWAGADVDGRRRLIGETALALLNEEGLAAVTMRLVAARLGVGTMTLYTYVEGQHGLHREIVRRGFEMLNCQCEEHDEQHGEPAKPEDWLEGAKLYLRFAQNHPNLYKLMFDHPMTDADRDLLHGGFQPYLEGVTSYLSRNGMTCLDELPKEARRQAGRMWIALHGLAMLAIAGRVCVLEGDIEDVLRDLLPRVAPS